jgi:phosphate starvation-inducible PhoH-like protein
MKLILILIDIKQKKTPALKEIKIKVEIKDPLHFFGVNSQKFKLIEDFYPLASFVNRGNEIMITAEDDLAGEIEKKIRDLIHYANTHSAFSEEKIRFLLGGNMDEIDVENEDDHIILHGRNNKVIKARTATQYKLIKAVSENEIVFAIGPAGTGKTYTSVALAVQALKAKEVRRIILTRPAVEAGESLGFLPGDLREKIDPYLRPLYDALDDMLPAEKLQFYLDRKIIELAPLAFMRGRTLDGAFVILDEAQNCSDLQLKMFLTRMGPSAKFVVNGDLTQIDLPSSQKSGLLKATKILKDIKGIDVLEFNVQDVTRHKIVKDIIKAYSKKSISQ